MCKIYSEGSLSRSPVSLTGISCKLGIKPLLRPPPASIIFVNLIIICLHSGKNVGKAEFLARRPGGHEDCRAAARNAGCEQVCGGDADRRGDISLVGMCFR